MSKIFGKIYQVILQLDTLSPGPEITHLRNPRYYNLVGVFFTLFSVLLGIFALKEDIEEFVKRENPDITYLNKYNTDQNILFDPKEQKISFAIFGFDIKVGFTAIPVEQLIMPFLTTNSMTNFTLQVGDDIQNTNTIFLQKCPSWMFENYNDYLDYDAKNITKDALDEIIKSSFCLPAGLKPFLLSNEQATFSQPSLIFKQDFLKTIIAKYPKVNVFFLQIRYQSLEMSFEGSDYENKYYKKAWKTVQYAMSPTYFNALNYKLSAGLIIRERKQMIFPIKDRNTTTFFDPDDTIDAFPIAESGGDYNFMINFGVRETYLYCKLKYRSIDGILADFGGILQIFFAVGLFFAEALVRPFLNRSLLNHTQNFHLADPEDENKLTEVIKFLSKHEGCVDPPFKQKKEQNNLNSFQNKNKDLLELNNSIERRDIFDYSQVDNNNPKTLELINLGDISSREPQNKLSYSISPLQDNQFVLNPAETIKKIAQNTKKRITKTISFSSILRIVYCYSCSKNRDKIINRISEEFEKKCEITEITKLYDDIKVLKSILLTEQQQKLFLFPSINLSKTQEDDEKEEEGDEIFESNTKIREFEKGLKEKVKELILIDWNLKDKKDRVLLRNIISSVV